MRPCGWCGSTELQPHFSHLDLCKDCNLKRLDMDIAARKSVARRSHPAGKAPERRAKERWLRPEFLGHVEEA